MTAQNAPAPSAAPAIALDDIRALVQKDLPPVDMPAAPKNLGDFAPHWQWMTGAQNKAKPVIRHPRIALFLSAHGSYPTLQQNLADLPKVFSDSKHPLTLLAAQQNADLQIYELDLETPSADIKSGAAMTAENAVQAIAYGMMSVQPGVDFLILATGNAATPVLAEKMAEAIAKGSDALEALLRFGGFDLAACLGAALAARLARVPVLLDDSADVILPLLTALNPQAADHIHLATDILPQEMQATPALRACLALPLLQALAQAV